MRWLRATSLLCFAAFLPACKASAFSRKKLPRLHDPDVSPYPARSSLLLKDKDRLVPSQGSGGLPRKNDMSMEESVRQPLNLLTGEYPVQRMISLVLGVFLILSSPVAHALEANAELLAFAQEKRAQLQQDVINIPRFMELSFWDRHKWKIIGGAALVGAVAVSAVTMGAAAPAAGAGASGLVGTAAAGSALSEATFAGAVSMLSLSEDGELKLTDDMRAKVLDYYDENYRSWLYLASSEKEFAEIAWKNIASFMDRNSR